MVKIVSQISRCKQTTAKYILIDINRSNCTEIQKGCAIFEFFLSTQYVRSLNGLVRGKFDSLLEYILI